MIVVSTTQYEDDNVGNTMLVDDVIHHQFLCYLLKNVLPCSILDNNYNVNFETTCHVESILVYHHILLR